ncbi:HD domain-containing protein [Actinomycetospora sp. NBRC 106378]|uniref:HD domain-containing protein n=1 Tax=Actinomycetospora sp. NBRC 106378 TaxID=3032208 RepID=UPI0024A5A4EF|nr:HD domain-containing protein [Actinomycetospora sp. NBRC 106378]GLZ56262.1 hypothetical protein Acsp07_58790 [Actinomycetospora sp. NBRC 106378]
MAAPAGIDHTWAEATGGNLDGARKRALFAPLARTVARYPGLRLRLALGRRGAGGIDLGEVRFPDTRLARDAQDTARSDLDAFLLEHSYRTYLFALALARLDAVDVDEELAFVASMLHDLDLGRPTPGRCFAVVGAQRAEEFARARDAPPERARRIAAEISGHVTVGGYEDLRSEGGFAGAGAVCDLLGLRLDELAPEWVSDVLRTHPRDHFKRDLVAAWRAEGRAVPDGRVRWLTRYGMVPILIHIAPLP